MMRLGQGCTPIRGKLAPLCCGGSRNDLCYFNCGGGRQNNDKRAPPVGLWWLNIPFLYPNSIPWFVRVCGSCQANRESLSYLVIDF
jgi:hypothetical protein